MYQIDEVADMDVSYYVVLYSAVSDFVNNDVRDRIMIVAVVENDGYYYIDVVVVSVIFSVHLLPHDELISFPAPLHHCFYRHFFLLLHYNNYYYYSFSFFVVRYLLYVVYHRVVMIYSLNVS